MKSTIKSIITMFLVIMIVFSGDIIIPVDWNPFVTTAEAATSVKISKSSITIGTKDTYQLRVKGTSKKITWWSSKKSVATVTSKGKVTAKKKGTATITAKVGSKKYTCKVTVKTPTISKKTATMVKGKTYTLKISNSSKTVTWTSSNKTVATVSKGKIAAKKAGTATIKAKVGTRTLSCKVTVKSAAISATTKSLTVGDTATLKVTGGTVSKWTSSNTAVAAVSSAGKVTAKKAGTATITATVGVNTLRCKVTVKNKTYGTVNISLNDEFVGGKVADATYTVYTGSGCSTKAKTTSGADAVFRTTSSGSNSLTLYSATYYIKATAVPQNYVKSTEATKVVVDSGKSMTVSIPIVRIYDLQTNYPNVAYNAVGQTGKTIYSSGCAPTSLGNILRNYMGISEATTKYMCSYAQSVGARTTAGTSMTKLLAAASKEYGFTYSQTTSFAEVLAHIRAGNMALAQTSEPPFSDGGHIMAVVGEINGALTVIDPYWPSFKKARYMSYGITTTSIDGLIYVTELQASGLNFPGINYYYLITKN